MGEAHFFHCKSQPRDWALSVQEEIMHWLMPQSVKYTSVSQRASEVKRHIRVLHFYHIENNTWLKCILLDFGQSGTLLKWDLALSAVSCSMVIEIPLTVHGCGNDDFCPRQLCTFGGHLIYFALNFFSCPTGK